MEEGEKIKLVLCVRQDISMSEGKKCAHCSHAAIGCYQKALETNPMMLFQWNMTGGKTIVLKIESLELMNTVRETCNDLQLINYSVRDAGRTEVSPGTYTVIGIGPGPSSLIDAITGDFKLL